MQFTYYEADDILVLRLSNQPIIREQSQDWNIHISYAEDGAVVEVVILEACRQGLLPVQYAQAA